MELVAGTGDSWEGPLPSSALLSRPVLPQMNPQTHCVFSSNTGTTLFSSFLPPLSPVRWNG